MGGFIGQGNVLFDRFDAEGNSQGYNEMGNAKVLEITEESEIKDRISYQKDTHGQALDSVAMKQPAKLAITLDDYDTNNLAIALLGTSATLTQSAANSVSAQISAKIDKWQQLDYKNLSAVTASISGGSDFTLNTDMFLKLEAGMIMITDDGIAVVEGNTINLVITAKAIAGTTITGSTTPTVRGSVRMDGENKVDGYQYQLTIYDATFTPTTPISWLGDDYSELGLEGTCATPTGQTSPYKVEIFSTT